MIVGTCEQNIDCGAEAVLTSTHNLCFGAKIRKIGIPLQTPQFYYIKVGFRWVFIAWICFPDNLQEAVRKAAAEAILVLTGAKDKETLFAYLDSHGVTEGIYNSKEDEVL